MRRGRAVLIGGLAGLLAAAPARSQDEKPAAPAAPAAAPAAGVPGPFRGFVVVDERYTKENVRNRAGKIHDLVVEAALSPVAAVFSRTLPADDAPLTKLAKALNEVARKNRFSNPTPFVAFLTLDKPYAEDETRAEKAAAVKAVGEQWKTPLVPLVVAAGKEDAPGQLAAWGVGDGDDLVVVVANRMRVLGRWAFPADKPPTDADIKAIADVFEKEARGGN